MERILDLCQRTKRRVDCWSRINEKEFANNRKLFANFFKFVRELFNLQTIFINFRVLILWHFSKSKEEDYRSVVSAGSDGWKTCNNRLGGGPLGIDFDGEPW